jgi:hypothetical protein
MPHNETKKWGVYVPAPLESPHRQKKDLQEEIIDLERLPVQPFGSQRAVTVVNTPQGVEPGGNITYPEIVAFRSEAPILFSASPA